MLTWKWFCSIRKNEFWGENEFAIGKKGWLLTKHVALMTTLISWCPSLAVKIKLKLFFSIIIYLYNKIWFYLKLS